LQLLAIMGEPVFAHQREGHPYTCAFQSALDAQVFSESALKDLAGNAMHEPTLGFVLLFALSSLARVSDKPILHAVRNSSSGSGSDSDGEDECGTAPLPTAQGAAETPVAPEGGSSGIPCQET
jgi:hypothetical protein